MTQTQQHCITPDQLLTFLRGQLSFQEETELQLHLNDCLVCRERLENAAADASSWNEAKEFFGNGALHSSSEDSTNGHDEATQGSQRIRQVLDALGPTDDPESLGRIGGYEVTGVVGAGGMGVVLKAHDRSLDRIVAIKVMSPHLASNGSARKRFAREAKAAAAVLHPNVIAIHGVASEEASPYLVMPYVRGASLQKRIDTQGPLPLKDTLRIGAQIAAGLAAAHDQGLVHRDIKPANILLEEGVERVTITDFGLARAVDDASMTCSGVIAGTPQYMSPEQTRGEPIDARSDLFSFGSVMYAMCAGRSPFRAETTYGVLHRIANDHPTPICDVNSDVPVWLGHIIERLMAKRPDDRFESATQVAELLEGCLAHVQQPTAIQLPVGVQALAALAQSRTCTLPESREKNRPKDTLQQIPPIGKYIAAAAFAFSLVFAGILIVLELDKGTLTIESDLDDVPIRIMQGEKVVKSLTVSREGKTTRISAGKYIVEIGQKFDKAVIKDGGVELSRGATTIVKVTQTNANTPEDENAKDEAAKAWLRRPVVGATLDGKSFQLAGHDALLHCVMTNNAESLNRLLAMDKYDLDYVHTNGQWTLLQIALEHKCVETTSLLLRYGANPNFASKGTPLPLELAKRSGQPQLVALVQEYATATVGVVESERAANSVKRVMQYLSAVQKNDTETIKSIATGINNSDERTRDMSKLLGDQGVPKLYTTWFKNHSAVVALGPIASSDEMVDGRFLLFTLNLVDERWSIVDIDLKAKPFLLDILKPLQSNKVTKDLNPFEARTLDEVTSAYNEQTRQLRTELFNPPIPDLTTDQMRAALLDAAEQYRKQGRVEIASALTTSAETKRLADRLTFMGMSGTMSEGFRQITPTFQSEVAGNARFAIVLRKAELRYSLNGWSSKTWGDIHPPITGKWKLVSVEQRGEKLTEEVFNDWRQKHASWTELTIDARSLTMAGENAMRFDFEIDHDAGALPQYTIRQDGNTKYSGVLMGNGFVEDTTLVLAVDIKGSSTPKTFQTKDGKTTNLTYRRNWEADIQANAPRKTESTSGGDEPATGLAKKLKVAKGETDELRIGQSYKIKLLVLGSDDLKPVSGATVEVTLIGDDGGDGGFADFKSDADGIAIVDKSLWPGRYQIQVRAPKGSRFRDTEFSKEESILVVHEDGRYSPREFRLVVDDRKPK